MRVRCPLCRQDNLVEDNTSLASLTCVACGTNFTLYADDDTVVPVEDSDRTQTHRQAPRVMGHFQLLERVGVGSFGAVWKARDIELDRIVAVKIPRAGILGREEAEAFLREARAASQLRHPRIVPVYQVGSEDGMIYIVSEFIPGATLAEWLSARRPTPHEAARIAIEVARALQHAHDKGVIHRDLKPGNIMMDLDGAPHLMDFGLARRAATDLTVTVEGQVLGTPAYMSPEQARGDSHRADHRSDIYSLGVVLFQLLTGELPFRGSARMLLVQIMQDEAPSLRKLSNHVPRDLDTICLKCLEKEPDRRYASAAQVADELQRFIDGEPIVARPIGRVERNWRWCRRRPALSITGALLIAVTVGGFAGVTWQWRRAQHHFNVSQHNLREANAQREQAERNLEEAGRQRDRAERNFERARSTVNRFLRQVPNHELLREPGLERIKADLQALACKYYAELAAENTDDPRVQLELGQAHFFYALTLEDLGRNDEAVQQYSAARDAMLAARARLAALPPDPRLAELVRQNLAACLGNLAGLQLIAGQLDQAASAFEEILTVQRQLLDDHPDDVRYRVDVVISLMNLSMIERDAGQFDAALEHNRQARRMTEQPVQASRGENLTKDALREYQPRLYLDVAYIETQRGNLPAALAAYEQAAEIGRELLAKYPTHGSLGRDVGIADRARADLLDQLQKHAEADAMWQSAIAIQEQVCKQSPDVVEYRSELANSYAQYALFQLKTMRPSAAAASLRSQRNLIAGDANALYAVGRGLSDCVRLMHDSPNATSPEGRAESDRTAGDAVATLAAAVDAGFTDWADLQSSPQLDAVRSRADFQKLLQRKLPE